MDKHRDEKLDSLIGKLVEIVFTDGETTRGTLGYTPEYSALYGYKRPHFYNCNNYSFRKSLIKQIREI